MYGRCLLVSSALHVAGFLALIRAEARHVTVLAPDVGVRIVWVDGVSVAADSPPPAPPNPAPPVAREETFDPEPAPVAEVPATKTFPVAHPAPPAETPPAPARGTGTGSSGPAAPKPGACPPPIYPEASRRAGHEGLVLLSVLVSTNGVAGNVAVSAGSGHRRLDDAALNAVASWQFLPAQSNGMPYAAHIVVPVRFELR